MRRFAGLLAAGLALAGCSRDEPRMPAECLDPAAIATALEAAPGDVRLAAGSRLSTCVELARTNAQLHELGLLLTERAEALAISARDRADVAAAARLGFLAGAVRRGAAASGGVQAELARRVERSAVKLDRASAPVRRALADGARAGEARG